MVDGFSQFPFEKQQGPCRFTKENSANSGNFPANSKKKKFSSQFSKTLGKFESLICIPVAFKKLQNQSKMM